MQKSKKTSTGWQRDDILKLVTLIITLIIFYFSTFYESTSMIIIEPPLDDLPYNLNYPIILYESNSSLDNYYSTNDAITFTLHNPNNFAVQVNKIQVEVTEFTPYDSYLAIFYDKFIEKEAFDFSVDLVNNIKIGTCTILPYEGCYYVQNPFDHTPTYLKLFPNDCDTIRLYLRTNTEGLYTVKFIIHYTLRKKTRKSESNFTMSFVREPEQIDYVNNAFYYDDSMVELSEDQTKSYEAQAISKNIPNHFNQINREDIVESFLSEHFENSNINDTVFEALDYIDNYMR